MSCASPSPATNANTAVPPADVGGFFSNVTSSFDLSLFDKELPGQGADTTEVSPQAIGVFQHAVTEFSESKTTSFLYSHCCRNFPSGGACSLTACDSSVKTMLECHEGTPQCHFTVAGTCGPQFNAGDNPPVKHRRRLIIPRLLKLPPTGKQWAYEWKPQADQELERKRQRAIKAHRNREKANQRVLNMNAEIASLGEAIASLQGDVRSLKLRIAAIRRQLCALTPER